MFIALSRSIMKPSGCFVGLPVSRREPPCRCGGRRGGLNDSQHCAVGPGLQSPQRWSFPPASISLAVSLHSTRSSSPLSIQPFRYAETSTFFSPRPSHRCFSNLPMAFSVRPTMTDLQPKFAPRIFYRVAKSFHESQSCANDFVNLSASHILPQLNIINIKSIVLKKNVSLWLINVRFPLERELSKSS